MRRLQCGSSGGLLRLVAAMVLVGAGAAHAQPANVDGARADSDDLGAIESRLGQQYDRLELLAGRLAELSASAQPRRAELLRQLVARGREQDVHGQFDQIVAALGQGSFSSAVAAQAGLQTDLEGLLDLLLQEDRDRRLNAERKRVLRYLQDLNRLIRLQRGVKARTSGGEDAEELSSDQKRVRDDSAKLQTEIEQNEDSAAPPSGDDNGGQRDGADAQNSDNPSGSQNEGGEGKSKPSEADDDETKPKNERTDDQDGQKTSEPNEQESESGESQPGGQRPRQGSGQSQPGQSQSPQSQQQSEGEASPLQRTVQRLQRAQQRMQEAQKRLNDAQRNGALDQQERAVEELEMAKAELERILRQLREEEMERMLVLLETRFRKMLDEQIEIHQETTRLDEAQANVQAHELEIAAGRLSRRESLIVREADRALVLLREDGTSVAFPESVEQARDDMQTIASRLNLAKVDLITQAMEEDVIAALEETLAALQQAIDDLRDQRAQQNGQGGEASPGEQPLVDQLAELRMIRALQARVNRRTQQFGAMIEGEQALQADLIEQLEQLAVRQAKIFEATRDLETGSNR